VFEFMQGAWWFTDNTNFLNGNTREQKPILATQFYLTYRFSRQMWLAADTNFFTGGRTTIGGKQNLDLQRNSRVGATLFTSAGSARRHSHVGEPGRVYDVGADFNAFSLGYNFAWVR
jgi:hypothetical protein